VVVSALVHCFVFNQVELDQKKKKKPPLKILLSCPLMPAPFFVNAAAFEDFLHLHQSFTNRLSYSLSLISQK
jgi:hypothetical protein